MLLVVVLTFLVLPTDNAEAQRRRKSGDRVRVYRTDAEFWRTLEEQHPDEGAVVLENEQLVELKWNSAVTGYDSEWTMRLVYAVIDAERADELRQWAEWVPPGGDVKRFEVVVTRGDQQSAARIEEDEIYLEEVRGGFQRQRFAIPNFEDHLVIEITRELYIGRHGIPYLELPIDFPFPVRRSEIVYRTPLPPQSKRRTPLEQWKETYLGYWKLFGPEGVDSENDTRGNILTQRWIWRDLPARDRLPFLSPPHRLRDVVIIGVDATVYDVMDMARDLYDDGVGPVAAEIAGSAAATELNAFADASVEEQVEAVHAWIRDHLDLDRGQIGFRAHPRSLREAMEKGAHPVDACVAMVGLLARLGVESHPMWVHRRGFSQSELRVFNPYFWNHMVVYVPALDPTGKIRGGIVDVARPEIPTGSLDPWLAGSGAIVLDGRTFPTVTLPRLRSNPATVDATLTGSVDDEGTLTGILDVDLGGLAVAAVRGRGPSGRLPVDPDDVLAGLGDVLALVPRAEVRREGIRCTAPAVDRVHVKVPVRVPACLQDAGDIELLAASVAYPAWWDEELPAGERILPLDLGIPYRFGITTEVTLPSGMRSAEPPQDVDLLELGLDYRRRSSATTAFLSIEERFAMGRTWVPEAEYDALRIYVEDLRLVAADPAALVR
jgi:hypothetical protein